jgi:hypothetical protein
VMSEQRELELRIAKGERLTSSEAVKAHQLGLGKIYRSDSGEICLKGNDNERGVFKRSLSR